jgi:hypothetical protein
VRTRASEAVRALVSGGARVRLRNRSGSTPLHLAVQDTGRGGAGTTRARIEQAKIIAILIDAGARVDGQGRQWEVRPGRVVERPHPDASRPRSRTGSRAMSVNHARSSSET